MNKVLKGLGIALAIVGVFAIAMVTMPETDYCTPYQIGRYTNVIISHQECVSMSRCIIEPKDIREFHEAQHNFQQCVMEISGEAQRKLEESKE